MQIVEEKLWPDIAHDIAMLSVPAAGAATYTAADIAKNHGISLEAFTNLMQLSSFQMLVQEEVKRIKSLGPHAGARIRAEAMATPLLENLFNKAISNELNDELAIKLLSMLLKSAGLEQPPEVLQAQQTSNTVNIAFNIPRLHNSKLNHIAAQPQTNVINVEGQRNEQTS